MKKSQCGILLVLVLLCCVSLRPQEAASKIPLATDNISAPKLIFSPDPEYSEKARRTRLQGLVVLSVVVDPKGRAQDIRVIRSLGGGLDEKAIEAVRAWKFSPATKDGVAVAVKVKLEVAFHLDK
jgi:TonB family protein